MNAPKSRNLFALLTGIVLPAPMSVADAFGQDAEGRPRNRFDNDVLRETFGLAIRQAAQFSPTRPTR